MTHARSIGSPQGWRAVAGVRAPRQRRASGRRFDGADARTRPPPAAPTAPPADLMKAPFEDDFEHPVAPPRGRRPFAETGEPSPPPRSLRSSCPAPTGSPRRPGIWHIEGGRLCGEHARNHGIWLKRRSSGQRAHRVRRGQPVDRRRPQGRVLGRRPFVRDRALVHQRHELPHDLRRLAQHVPRPRAHQRARDRPQGDHRRHELRRSAREAGDGRAALPLQGRAHGRQDRKMVGRRQRDADVPGPRAPRRAPGTITSASTTGT